MPPGFEGGQTPLWKRVPKRGFQNLHRRQYAYVNLATLAERFEEGAEITPDVLLQRRIIAELQGGVKILGHGEPLTKKLIIHAHRFSKKAVEMIEKAGGRAIVLERPQPQPPRAEMQGRAKKREGD
jgi:large subunit ribosomal protein L15